MGVFQTCKDLTGQKFGLLTVLERYPNANDGHSRWLCRCECGNTSVVQSNNLKSTSKVKSCGCLIRKRVGQLNLIHGKTKTKEFKAWDSMHQRCYNPKNPSYYRYGGRGITICSKWRQSFQAFLEDMGAAPAKHLSIDRINNDGNYEPGNCKWSTAKEQRANQSPKQPKIKS